MSEMALTLALAMVLSLAIVHALPRERYYLWRAEHARNPDEMLDYLIRAERSNGP